MKSNETQIEACGRPLRYSVSAVLILLLLGLMPAACSDPDGKGVSQGTPRSSTYGSDATEEQPRGGDMSEPDGEGGHPEEQQSEGRPPN